MAVIEKTNNNPLNSYKKRYVPNLSSFLLQCESNYQLLIKLIPDLEVDEGCVFGVAAEENSMGYVHIVVTERCKYTTTVRIVQTHLKQLDTAYIVHGHEQAQENKDWIPQPAMSIRLYHDAQMAEVLAFQRHSRIKPNYEYPNKKMYQRNEKAQLNKFLGEWLLHCHKFGLALEAPAISKSL